MKKQCYKKKLCFALLKFSKVEMFFQKQDLYTWMKGKNRPGNLITRTAKAMKKNYSETRRNMIQTGRFTESFLCPFAQEKIPLTQPSSLLFFFAGSLLSLLLDTIDTSGLVFLIKFFFFNVKTKLKQPFS